MLHSRCWRRSDTTPDRRRSTRLGACLYRSGTGHVSEHQAHHGNGARLAHRLRAHRSAPVGLILSEIGASWPGRGGVGGSCSSRTVAPLCPCVRRRLGSAHGGAGLPTAEKAWHPWHPPGHNPRDHVLYQFVLRYIILSERPRFWTWTALILHFLILDVTPRAYRREL